MKPFAYVVADVSRRKDKFGSSQRFTVGWKHVCENDRPHPQEREKRSPSFVLNLRLDCANALPINVESLKRRSLSPWERAGVRASVNLFSSQRGLFPESERSPVAAREETEVLGNFRERSDVATCCGRGAARAPGRQTACSSAGDAIGFLS